MSYQRYGIEPDLVARVKQKLKDRGTKERVKELVDGITKADLQSRPKIKSLIRSGASILREPLSEKQEEQITAFVIDMKIDPNNTFHLLKLWSMFR